ncbi:MAG: Hpt domain-containing protein [Sphaerochaetaceae bacterium]
MSQLLERLRDWGADVDDGMQRIYADEEFYTKCLNIFKTDENFQKLDIALLARNYNDAFTAAHTLKGVSGNLSLDPLYKSLCVLTEKLRAKDYSNLDSSCSEVKRKEMEFLKIMNFEG